MRKLIAWFILNVVPGIGGRMISAEKLNGRHLVRWQHLLGIAEVYVSDDGFFWYRLRDGEVVSVSGLLDPRLCEAVRPKRDRLAWLREMRYHFTRSQQ